MMSLMPAAAQATPDRRSVFTAPYSAGNPGTTTNCSTGVDVCSADATGGAGGVFDLASAVARRDVTAAGTDDVAFAYATAMQRIRVPRGVSQVTVEMTFDASDMVVRADAARGSAQADVSVRTYAHSNYCSRCSMTEGSATLASSAEHGGVPLPGDDTGPNAVVALTITAPPGVTLPAGWLHVVGAAFSRAALSNESCPACEVLAGRAGSASSSATVTLTQMTVSYA